MAANNSSLSHLLLFVLVANDDEDSSSSFSSFFFVVVCDALAFRELFLLFPLMILFLAIEIALDGIIITASFTLSVLV